MSSKFTNWTTFGQNHALNFFLKSVEKNMLSHAYLINGPKGVGKLTIALDLAFLVNFSYIFQDDQIIDVQKNDQASRIRRGLNSDVKIIDIDTPYFLDGKEIRSKINISIEHIKNIKKDTSIKAFEGKSKIFIIQNSHRMTTEAANAFLKILEEPFEDNYFILTTDSINNIPKTIISRCQIVNLNRVEEDLISEMLQNRFQIDVEKSKILAHFSRGCPGWAISAVSDEILLDSYYQMSNRIFEIISENVEGRLNYSRKLSNQFRKSRSEVYSELDGWIDWFRDLALIKNELPDYILFRENIDAYNNLSNNIEIEAIVDSINLLFQTKENLDKNVSTNLVLDVMLLELPILR